MEITLNTTNDTVKIIGDIVMINNKLVDFQKEGKPYAKDCYGGGHAPLIRDFYHCVESGEKFVLDEKECAKVVELILGVYENNRRK